MRFLPRLERWIWGSESEWAREQRANLPSLEEGEEEGKKERESRKWEWEWEIHGYGSLIYWHFGSDTRERKTINV